MRCTMPVERAAADDDLATTAALRAGDAGALRAAYLRHKSDVLAVAAAVLGRSSVDVAWDVLHDVFVALARTAPGLADNTNLRAYLARAAANRARDVLRSKHRQPAPLSENDHRP